METAQLPGTRVHEAVPGRSRLTAEVLWSIPRVGDPVPAPDGRRIVVPVTSYGETDPSGTTRLWLIQDGAASRPLTSEDVSATAPSWSPDGSRLLFLRKAKEDGARSQLHELSLDGGEARRITDLPLGVVDARWTPDGASIIVAAELYRDHPTIEATATERDRRADDPVKARITEDRLARFWDRWLTDGAAPHFFRVDPESGDCHDLTPRSSAWLDFMEPRGQFDIAPDGAEIAWAGIVCDGDRQEIISRIFRVPTSGGPAECLTPDIEGGAVRPRYAPDGRSIVYGSKADRYFYADRIRLQRYDRATGDHAPWCDSWDRSPSGWSFAADGSLLLVAEDAARVHLYALRPDADTPTILCRGGTIGGPRAAADESIVFTRQSLRQPAEVYTLPRHADAPQQLTRFTAGALADVAIGEVREMETIGAEGETVQSFIVLPPDHDGATALPFVNVVHGGPHGVSGDNFHYRWNPHVFAAPGNVVATPNFQGSTSWGQDFAQRIQGGWGDRPYRDVMAVTDAMVESGLVDERRMAATGASYGGYMMAWIAGHTNRFACIVNHAGVYNTLSQYASDVTQGRDRSFGGEPWTNLDAIDRYNPARFTADSTTPMFVIHGELDYRVPYTQGLECYNVLKAKGVPARLMVFPDENHWVLKRHNALRWWAEVLGWLERWL